MIEKLFTILGVQRFDITSSHMSGESHHKFNLTYHSYEKKEISRHLTPGILNSYSYIILVKVRIFVREGN